MSLKTIDLPSPVALRAGWAALAALSAARGWGDDIFANESQWHYHDGGGNWACLRFQSDGRAVLVGHDHEYSETYFGRAAEYFGEEETDLLKGAPDWWSMDLDPKPFGEWIGFVYGWEGQGWQRADYSKADGFEQVGLLNVCTKLDRLIEFASAAPGLEEKEVNVDSLRALVEADTQITEEVLGAAVPGWDVAAGVAAARKFALIQL